MRFTCLAQHPEEAYYVVQIDELITILRETIH